MAKSQDPSEFLINLEKELWTGDGPDGLFENQVLTNGYLLLRPKEREKPAFYIENINALGVNGRSFEVQMQDKWDLKEKATLQGKNHAQFMDVGKLGKSWPYPKTPERNVLKLLEVISNQNSKKRIPYANVIDGTNIESNWKFPSKLVFDVGPMVPGVTHPQVFLGGLGTGVGPHTEDFNFSSINEAGALGPIAVQELIEGKMKDAEKKWNKTPMGQQDPNLEPDNVRKVIAAQINAPKLWAVWPDSRGLEKWFKKQFPQACSKFYKHKQWVINPFHPDFPQELQPKLFLQYPGDIVITGPGKIHQVTNLGITVCRAWNFSVMPKERPHNLWISQVYSSLNSAEIKDYTDTKKLINEDGNFSAKCSENCSSRLRFFRAKLDMFINPNWKQKCKVKGCQYEATLKSFRSHQHMKKMHPTFKIPDTQKLKCIVPECDKSGDETWWVDHLEHEIKAENKTKEDGKPKPHSEIKKRLQTLENLRESPEEDGRKSQKRRTEISKTLNKKRKL